MVLVGAMALFAAAPMHAIAPHVQSQPRQFPSSIEKIMARSPLICRSMASDVQPNGSAQGHKLPKAEPFNQSRLSRLLREPSLLEKAEHALAERCTHLEGDEAFRCWEALFEFEDIKEAYEEECDAASGDDRGSACQHLERFQNLVRQSEGVSGLIDNIRMVARTTKMQHEQAEAGEEVSGRASRPVVPEDGGLPQYPVGEESSGLLPESDLTRMLRHRGSSPAWFTQRPDHEYD